MAGAMEDPTSRGRRGPGQRPATPRASIGRQQGPREPPRRFEGKRAPGSALPLGRDPGAVGARDTADRLGQRVALGDPDNSGNRRGSAGSGRVPPPPGGSCVSEPGHAGIRRTADIDRTGTAGTPYGRWALLADLLAGSHRSRTPGRRGYRTGRRGQSCPVPGDSA
jgi:hypothetical protein